MTAALVTGVGRCPRCGFHMVEQGHRSEIDGEPTGCVDDGPLGLRLAQERRDTGMARTVNAHPEDAELIDLAIRQLTAARREWTANDLRTLLPSTIHQPVIGARVAAAARAGRIVRVGYKPSTKANTHGHPIAVWRSP